MGSGEKDEAWS